MAEYLFDVFFSYKRDPESDEWHAAVVRQLEFWLRKEINVPKARIFFDTQNIETGEQWKDTILESLKASKCLVGVWSPDYFHSRWCTSEWQTFVKRETLLKLKAGSLIAPARYYDGDYFPRHARGAQMTDFSKYTSTLAYFWKTDDAYQFEQTVLKGLAQTVARKIKAAPTFDDNFPVVTVHRDSVPSPPPVPRPSDVVGA